MTKLPPRSAHYNMREYLPSCSPESESVSVIPRRPPRNSRREFQGGFSLIELMIAITLGLLIMTGLVSIFVKNSLARSEIERSNRQIESGRYAMTLLTEDLRMAGFFQSFNPYDSIINATVNAPPLSAFTDPVTHVTTPALTVMPDPCATSVANLNNAFFFHVQGYDNGSTIPSCITDVRAGSDILVIRRVSTCVAGPTTDPGCDTVIAGTPYFQASNCNQATQLAINTGSTKDYTAYFVLDTDTTKLTKNAIDCAAIAPYRRYLTHIYFVANNDVSGDGIPTLKRGELGATGGAIGWTIVPLVEGIETMQLEYGVDANDDGVIDGYTADPSSYNACAGTGTCLLNWLRTYAVSINLLARNIETSPGYKDTKTYILGLKADGTNNVFPATGTYGDAYKRHAYTATARLENPSGRKTP